MSVPATTRRSEPAPPWSASLPAPPVIVSSPAPPVIWSFSLDPVSVWSLVSSVTAEPSMTIRSPSPPEDASQSVKVQPDRSTVRSSPVAPASTTTVIVSVVPSVPVTSRLDASSPSPSWSEVKVTLPSTVSASIEVMVEPVKSAVPVACSVSSSAPPS